MNNEYKQRIRHGIKKIVIILLACICIITANTNFNTNYELMKNINQFFNAFIYANIGYFIIYEWRIFRNWKKDND